jgi:hypothetical protein
MITFPRAVDQPRALPELRAALIGMASPEGVWTQAEMIRLMAGLDDADQEQYGPAAVKHALNTVYWYAHLLPQAQLIYVSPEMTDFIVAAAEGVPPDTTLALTDAPAPTGLVVFGRPVYGTDAGPERPGAVVRVDGMMWGEVGLPPRDVDWTDPSTFDEHTPHIAGVSAAMFRMVEPGQPDEEALGGPTYRTAWVPLGRSDWPWGDELASKPSEYLPHASPEQWTSMMEDRRLLTALWAVINQRRLVDRTEVWPDRALRRRLERMGQAGRDERVSIVHLRRAEATAHAEGSGRHVGVRFVVRGFYRRQPVGPGRTERKLVYVAPHWRGPLDAPVVHAERIWSVDR